MEITYYCDIHKLPKYYRIIFPDIPEIDFTVKDKENFKNLAARRLKTVIMTKIRNSLPLPIPRYVAKNPYEIMVKLNIEVNINEIG